MNGYEHHTGLAGLCVESAEGQRFEQGMAVLTQAQVHAALALAGEQRLANLIAVVSSPGRFTGPEVAAAHREVTAMLWPDGLPVEPPDPTNAWNIVNKADQ